MKNYLLNMLDTIQEYKHEPSCLMFEYVSQRLTKSFNQYEKELQYSLMFLTYKHEKSILKRLSKINDN